MDFIFNSPALCIIPGVHLETECQVKLYVSTETEARFSGFWCCVIKASADYRCPHNLGIEHFENQTVTYFEKEVGSVVLQSSINNIQSAKFQTKRTESTHKQLHVVCAFGILAASVFEACMCWTTPVPTSF